MSEAIHISAGPFTTPPAGSNLKRLVDEFEAEARSSSLPDTLGGCVALWAEELILEHLVELGMPRELADTPPLWLLDAIGLQAAYLRVDAPSIDQRKPKVGRRPYPNLTASTLGFAEYLRQGAVQRGWPENAICVATARSLGPGIDRHHVRRLAKYHMRQCNILRANDPKMYEVHLKTLIFLQQYLDEMSGALNAVALEYPRAPAFSRTESRRTSASARTR